MPDAAQAAEAFWAKVDRTGECWLYRGQGIPRRRLRDAAWVLAGNEPVPPGRYLCVTCGNRKCLRHLVIGTNTRAAAGRRPRHKGVLSETTRSKIAASCRRLRGSRNVRGEDHGRGKLTPAQAREARRSGSSLGELAKRFGVSRNAIWLIRHQRTWRHLR